MPIQSNLNDGTLELRIYDAIGPEWAGMIGAQSLMNAIDEAGDEYDEILVRINSPGGSAFEGIAMFNALKSSDATVTTVADGLAASAASLIFMAGSTRKINENAMLLVHNASGIAMGNASDMESVARDLRTLDKSIAQTYATITGNDANDVQATMDEDMLMNAQDALNDGYATEIVSGDVPQATFDKRLLNMLPKEVADRFGRREPSNNTKPETSDMTPEEFKNKHKDVVDGWLNEEHSNGYTDAKEDAKQMLDACGGDKAAAFQAFIDGKTIQDAKNERTQSLAQELEQAKAELAEARKKAEEFENGADPVTPNPKAEIQDEPDDKFEAVKKRAAKIKNEYARNAYIASSGFNPKDFDFED